MFSGLVRAVGAVQSLAAAERGCVLWADLGALSGGPFNGIELGASVAVNGVCLTIAELKHGGARFDISPATMQSGLLHELRAGDKLNLEPALTLQTPLGGHLMYGHIDGIAELRARFVRENFTEMEFHLKRDVGRLLAIKGAAAVDGVSLTVNEVTDHADHTRFTVMLVPHTLRATTLRELQPGARVHIEADALARHALRWLDAVNFSGK